MNNQRGGFISNLLIIPMAVVLMAAMFFLGYYVGSSRAKAVATGEPMPPLPEMVSEHLPKPEEYTFYKTLTDRDNKTVSIDVKPRPAEDAQQAGKPSAPADAHQDKSAKQGKKTEISAPKTKEAALRSAPASGGRLRYTIQIAAYPDKSLAADETKSLKKDGFAPFIVAFESGKGTWYRVRLGSFSSRSAAEKLLKDLKAKEGGSPFITLE